MSLNSEERVQSATASFVYHETLSEVENFCPSLSVTHLQITNERLILCSILQILVFQEEQTYFSYKLLRPVGQMG